MHLKRLLLISIFRLTLFCLPITAAAAESIINLLPDACYLSGEFSETRWLTGAENPLQSTGVFWFHCQQGLIWQTRSPMAQTLLYRSDGQHYLFTPDRATPELLNGRLQQNLADLLIGLIGADSDYIQRYFNVTAAAANLENTGRFDLVPRHKSMQRFIEYLTVERTEQQVIIRFAQPAISRTILAIYNTQSYQQFSQQDCIDRIDQTSCQYLLKAQ